MQLIDPKLLKLKTTEKLSSSNSIGLGNLRTMFLLGYWKKLVFTMNVDTGMQLTYKMVDVENFALLKDKCDKQSELT